jgi:DNA topoisomerase I
MKTTPAKEHYISSDSPETAARSVGLRYVHDNRPAIRRIRSGKSFRYLGPSNEPIRDEATLARIRSLVIPPAWTDVWICSLANGHLQATGRDVRRRKQYRYHPQWRTVRDETKFDRMVAFGQALPRLRARVEEDLGLPGLPCPKVLATVVQLLESTLIRVGNEEYARSNGSFGLTTLRNRHIKIEGKTVRFAFRGKSGIFHKVDVEDARLARVVRRCRDLPGHELFQYVDEQGAIHAVNSEEVNDYLREAAGGDFTAKDFRTWAGTVLAARTLKELAPFTSQAEAKRHVAAAIGRVAERLGNTIAVCRKCYVHPAVIEAYLDGTLRDALEHRVKNKLSFGVHGLDPEEKAVLVFLQSRL